MKKHKPIQVGDVFPTNEGGSVVVVDYYNAHDILIEHKCPHKHWAHVTSNQLRTGRIKNPYMPRIHGVGYVGVGEHPASIDGKDSAAYTTWSKMLERCYCRKKQASNPSYIGFSVEPEWHNFQNFAEWYESQPFKGDGYQLDKDILVKGNRVYSRHACRFVPAIINKILCSNDFRRGDLPMGVQEKSGRYYVKLSMLGKVQVVGSFSTIDEAAAAYKAARESYVYKCAEMHKDQMDIEIYHALCSYRVENHQ